MSNANACPNHLDRKTLECKAIIETPKGRRNKFDYDPEYQMFSLGGVLPEGMLFPFDFGFIPSTLAADGDPLDIMVLMDEPAHVGCILDVRIIGVIEAEQTDKGKSRAERNDRILGVSVHSYQHENATSIKDLQKSLLDQVVSFFENYNQSRGKQFKLLGIHGPRRALKALDKAIDAFKHNKKSG